MQYKQFNTQNKKWKVINFSHYKLSHIALKQLALKDKDIISIPAELKENMDVEEYVNELIAKLEWSDSYLIVLPGLSLLSGMLCRALAELQMPYNIVNLIRSREDNVFYINDIY